MEFSRQEYWSGLSFPFPRDLSNSRDQTWVSCISGRSFTVWATRGRLTFSFKPFWNMKGGTWMPRIISWGPELGLFLCSQLLAWWGVGGARDASGSALPALSFQVRPFSFPRAHSSSPVTAQPQSPLNCRLPGGFSGGLPWKAPLIIGSGQMTTQPAAVPAGGLDQPQVLQWGVSTGCP